MKLICCEFADARKDKWCFLNKTVSFFVKTGTLVMKGGNFSIGVRHVI